MGVSIQVEEETGVGIASCSGILRLGDAQEGAAALWENPDWLGTAAVWDFREARFDLSTSDVRRIARFIVETQPEMPPSRIAFVTARDLDFGMPRVFEVYREDPATEFRVFRDYPKALSWARGNHPGGL
jgi:hypothetical protein